MSSAGSKNAAVSAGSDATIWLERTTQRLTPSDRRAGYTYELAFRQFEVSDTSVFDRPQAGRAWFEGVIRDHLDIGRPSQVVLLFDRTLTRRTPGPFRTRVITKGVDPILSCYYKSSRIKQYFKDGRASQRSSSSTSARRRWRSIGRPWMERTANTMSYARTTGCRCQALRPQT